MQEAEGLPEAVMAAHKAKDAAYSERNRLVAVLSKVWPAHLLEHPADDLSWELDWRTIVCVHIPGEGQATWHVHDSERHMFAHLEGQPQVDCSGWDGHTTEEKYARLARFPAGCNGAQTDLSFNGPETMIPADRWDREEQGTWLRVFSDRLPIPVATLRRVGWLDQRGRVMKKIPGVAVRDDRAGSYTPLYVDCREDGH